MMKKTFVVVLLLAIFASCKHEIVPVEEFTPYIAAFSGNIAEDDPIVIELQGESKLFTEGEINKKTQKKLNKIFRLSPSVKGSVGFKNARTVVFTPSTPLDRGKIYTVTATLSDLIETDKRHEKFVFNVKVENKIMMLHQDDIVFNDDNTVDVGLTLYCEGFMNDAGNKDKLVQQVVSAIKCKNFDGKLTVVYDETKDVFLITLKTIKQYKTAYTVSVKVEGNKLGFDGAVEENIQIPEQEIFRVYNTTFDQMNKNKIEVVFTKKLDEKQNIKGVVQIPEIQSFTTKISGNKIFIYFEEVKVAAINLKIFNTLKNNKGEKLEQSYTERIVLEQLKPQLKLIKSGNILPDGENLILPFKTVNLKAVDVKIIKIYKDNIMSFLQDNNLNGDYSLNRYAALLYTKTIIINMPKQNYGKWQNHSLDLAKIIKQEPGAVYRVTLSFKKEYSTYLCDGASLENSAVFDLSGITENEKNYWNKPLDYFDDYDNWYSWYNHYDNWSDYETAKENPCEVAYFTDNKISVATNLLSTNIGIIAKTNDDGKIWAATSNILTTEPMGGVTVTAYNYPLQKIAEAKTDGDGFALLDANNAYFIVASKDGQYSYLKLYYGEDNSLSKFDVGGKTIEKGLQGYIYGERGVWRPGDTVFLTFILNDRNNKLPENHPVTLEMKDAQGQFYTRMVKTQGINGFYTFAVPTKQEDGTGLWTATISVGGVRFIKNIRIETIKPNRLKVNLDLGRELIKSSDKEFNASLNVAWLTGATAGNLNTDIEVSFKEKKTVFKGYEKYNFNARGTEKYNWALTENVFEGKLDVTGNVAAKIKMPTLTDAPAMLTATFTTRVFEPGGDASTVSQSVTYSPYPTYIGINVNRKDDEYVFDMNKTRHFDLVVLSEIGKPQNIALKYQIFRIDWGWWWDNDDVYIANYANSHYYKPVAEGTKTTVNGKASIAFEPKDWGRYLIIVSDKNSGVTTTDIVYFDDPYWSRAGGDEAEGVKILSFKTDKKLYKVGETAVVVLPAAGDGKALLAIENGNTVLKREWVTVKKGVPTNYQVKITKDMAPNCYFHVSLLQPHSQTVNDLPIRMYGVVPISVEASNTKLEPVISLPEVIRPESEFTVKVSEKNSQSMTYTIAVVDEGLLDITNFKTPNAWLSFYSKEALGIKTYDMYDRVIGAFGGKFANAYSIGGDEELDESSSGNNQFANRFKPVVRVLGPFTLKSGSNSHKITLPLYVGSVRVMVVAGQDGAYGSAGKTAFVRNPLMTLSTLPRVMSVNEKISLPVNVFALEDNIKDVTISISTKNGLVKLDKNSQNVSFSKVGDKTVFFTVTTGSKTGIEKFVVSSSSAGSNGTHEEIEIDVRNPNPPAVTTETVTIEKGKSAELNYAMGIGKDDWLKLELSRIPPVNLSRRFDFLNNYSYCCSEQVTSKAMPLLFVHFFKELDNIEQANIKANVNVAIKTLYSRQNSDGGFVYWSGNSTSTAWVTTYAGIFLLKAKENGYPVSDNVLTNWKKYQRTLARNWSRRIGTGFEYDEYEQAYRLYSLAVAGVSELGAMNRLKESENLSVRAKWLLAAAYSLDGKNNIAEEILKNAATINLPKMSIYYYNSVIDESIVLMTMVELGKLSDALKQAKALSKRLNNEQYFTSQSTAYSLMAMASFANKASGNIAVNWAVNGKSQKKINSYKAVVEKTLDKNVRNGSISISNNSDGVIFATVSNKVTPLIDTFPEMSNKLKINYVYSDSKGNSISVKEMKQSSDFWVHIEVSNISTEYLENLALTYILPSGWEVLSTTNDALEYQDIRDDRVYSYFNLRSTTKKRVSIRLQATYCGEFTLPAIRCEAMYQPDVQVRTKAENVVVVR
ncbi:MAG: alpha-2-macroglobulin [Bacteroidales bacterium]|jgi:uncharacterized protein YfaS (alpha-2-macroglobulin family)|nr:alpha-2-macroglobulin [Bacteroidales bacterium]